MNTSVNLNVPSSNGVSCGLELNKIKNKIYKNKIFLDSYPNITAFHNIILLSVGAPLTPTGGSSCNLKKRKIYQLFGYLCVFKLKFTF